MPHYTCTGDCKGISMQPGNCAAKECGKHRQPLTECNCTDGKHQELEENVEPGGEQAGLLNKNEDEEKIINEADNE